MSIAGSNFSLSTVGVDVDEVEDENARLRMQIALLKVENNDRKEKVKDTEDLTFKSALHGGWKPVSSTNVDKFLEKCGAGELSNVIFQLANVHFDLTSDDGCVRIYEKVGNKRYHEKTFELSKPHTFGDVSCVTYIADGVLKTIYMKEKNEEEEVEERFLKDGRLHVVMKRCGVKCTRVYERVGGKKVQVQQESKRIENLQAEIAKLKMALEKEKSKKSKPPAPSKPAQPAPKAEKITKSICGLWSKIDGARNQVTSLKVDSSRFMVRTLPDTEYSVFQIEGLSHGFKVNVVDNRLTLKKVVDGKEVCSEVYSVGTDGKLSHDFFLRGKLAQRSSFERVGEPL